MNPNSSTSTPEVKRLLAGPHIALHVMTLGLLAYFLGQSLYDNWPNWDHRELLLLVLAAIQTGLYLKRWVFTPLDASPRWWYMYFFGSLACCVPESLFAPYFSWMAGLYVGQMCAFLTPSYSVPSSILALTIIEFAAFGQAQLARRSVGEWVFRVAVFASWMVMGLFIKRIDEISQGRAELICELEAAKSELVLARDREVEVATLRERERLARDLHDNLGHALVTLTVQLEAVQRLLPVDLDRAGPLLEEMKTLSRSSTEALRRSLANLRAPGLGDKPLTQAVKSLCADASRRTVVKIDCQVAAGADGLPRAVAEALWHVAQEGLTNVEKHAQAQQVAVRLSLQPQLAVLCVTDDGVGLPPDAESKPGHYGLRGLRERVEGVGGTLLLTTAEPRGALIEARVRLIA
ncbi:MAG: sensor histidine kinase [Verrucomicrobiia bacterium]|jgi:signal transduction histidine kinase